MLSPRRTASTHELRAYSICCPIPRSVAMESAAISSARRIVVAGLVICLACILCLGTLLLAVNFDFDRSGVATAGVYRFEAQPLRGEIQREVMNAARVRK